MEFFLRKVYPWLIEVSSFSPLLPFIAGLVLYRKSNNQWFRLIFLFIVMLVLAEVAGQITVRMGTRNNLWIQHIYTPLEFCVLTVLYYRSFRQPRVKKGILLAAAVLILVSIGDATVGEGITKMNSFTRMVENALLISIAVLYFYKVANDLTITYLDRDPVFLLSCGLLIYKAGTSMAWAMFNSALEESYDTARMCLALIFILNVLFSAGMVLVLKRASEWRR